MSFIQFATALVVLIGVTNNSCAAFCTLPCLAAASKARKALSGGRRTATVAAP